MSQRLSFTVKPNLPPRLAPLAALAQDFWISWHFDAIRLFMRFGNDLLERYLGAPDEKYGPEVSVREQVDNIADEELWHTHERRRERMIWFARQRIVAQLRREHASERDLTADVRLGGSPPPTCRCRCTMVHCR